MPPPIYVSKKMNGSAPRGESSVKVSYRMAAPGSLEWGVDQIGTNVPEEQEGVSFDRECTRVNMCT